MGSAIDFLFDVEETSQSDCSRTSTLTSKNEALEALAHRIQLAARQPSELGRQLYQDITVIMERLRADDKASVALFTLASALVDMGYDVLLRHALGGGTRECFKSLRHEFLVVRGRGEFRGMEFIVEPSLRQHFAIPHPSTEYSDVLNRIPDVFVGGSCRLVSIVQLLCALMADSFQRQGLTLPPWRREAAMLSKWMPHPSHIRDLKLRPTGSFAGCSNTVTSSTSRPEQQELQLENGRTKGAYMNRVLDDITDNSNSRLTPDRDPSRLHAVLLNVPAENFGAGRVCAFPGCCPIADVAVGFDVGEELRTQIAAQAVDNGGEKYSDPSCAELDAGSGSIEADSHPSMGPRQGTENKPLYDLDDCASSCEEPFAADEEAGSFLLASESSGVNSLAHEYDDTSLPSSKASNDAAATISFFCAAISTTAAATTTEHRRFLTKSHRQTSTGMLPCRFRGTGLLSAKLLLGQLAAKTSSMAMGMPAPAEPLQPAPHVHLDTAAIHLVKMPAAKKAQIMTGCC